MHIDAKLWLWEHFEKSVKRIILHWYSWDREINLISLAHFDSGAYISRVQSALKVKILHQYASFLHVLIMCNDWMNAFMDKKLS